MIRAGRAGRLAPDSADSGIAIAALERYRMSLHKSGAKKRPFGFLVSAAFFVLRAKISCSIQTYRSQSGPLYGRLNMLENPA